MFGIDSFEVWLELDIDNSEDEPARLPGKLSLLNIKLMGSAEIAREIAARQNDKAVKELEYDVGDPVLLWRTELAEREGNKLWRPWVGAYVMIGQLRLVGYELPFEIGGKHARVHVNKLQKIHDRAVQSSEPGEVVLPDCMRLLKKVKGAQTIIDDETGQSLRVFKVQLARRKAPLRTKEADLPEVVVKRFHAQE